MNTNIGYIESDITNPLNYYGQSKREGEKSLVENYQKSLVIRTSWLFSKHGGNFIKNIVSSLTMSDTNPLSIVNDQFGSPTSAHALAAVSMLIIQQIFKTGSFDYLTSTQRYGLYHFSGNSKMSWFDFGNAIRYYCQLHTNIPLRS